MPKILGALKKHLFSLTLKQTLSLIFFLAFLLIIPLTVYAVLTQKLDIRKEAKGRVAKQRVLSPEEYIKQYEPADRKFEKIEIGERIVYFHQRMIGEAIVEREFINYQFEKKTNRFLKKTENWRLDLPEQLPPLKVAKEQAESMVKGEVKFAQLYFISPDSDIFSFKPTPKNPCWVVGSIDKNNVTVLTVIDAVTGEKIGLGVPPPSRGYSLSGPMNFAPCEGSWSNWYLNAYDWFEKMGYTTNPVRWPDEEVMKQEIEDSTKNLLYEIAHGDYYNFGSGCESSGYAELTASSEVRTWLDKREKFSFVFLASCDGMCQTDTNTFSYEFRKDSTEKTATVGYCGMGSSECLDCWGASIQWQHALFGHIYEEKAVKEAFNLAQAEWPMCQQCLRFAGDENYKIPLNPAPEPIPKPSPSLSPIPESCNNECLSRDFGLGYCDSAPVYPGETLCKTGEVNIGQTQDCYVEPGLLGVQKGCCCPLPTPSPTPIQQPDLVITKLEPSMSSPTSLKVDYQLSNQGQAKAPASDTYFYLDDKYKFYEPDPELSAGQSIPLLFYYSWSCPEGSHKIKLCADGGGKVQESDEKNNCLEKTLSCSGPTILPR